MNYRGIYEAITTWRQRGSTTAGLEAAVRKNGIFVVASHTERERLARPTEQTYSNIISLDDLGRGVLRTRLANGPMIIDNFAVTQIVRHAADLFVRSTEAELHRDTLLTAVREAITIVGVDGTFGESSMMKTFADAQGLVRAVRAIVTDRNGLNVAHQNALGEVNRLKEALKAVLAEVESAAGDVSTTSVVENVKAIVENALGVGKKEDVK